MSGRELLSPATEKDAPYIWVTWIAPLLDGSKQCQWAGWFQANYKFEKKTDQTFLEDWSVKHQRLLNRRVMQLEAEGYTVYVEDDNYFTILGQDKVTKIAGKADIVAIKGNQVIVEDCKTGKKRNYDPFQVLLYMLLLPLHGGPPHCRSKRMDGRLIYGEEIIDISHSLLTQEIKEAFRDLMKILISATPARKVPSWRECRYCKIQSGYCNERMDAERDAEEGQHDLF